MPNPYPRGHFGWRWYESLSPAEKAKVDAAVASQPRGSPPGRQVRGRPSPIRPLAGPARLGVPRRGPPERTPSEQRAIDAAEAADRAFFERRGRPARPVPVRSRDNTSYYQLGWEFVTGRGPRRREFRAGDPALETLRRSESIDRLREGLREKPSRFGEPVKIPHSLGGFGGIGTYLKQYGAVPTGGRMGNLAEGYLGSYVGSYNVLSIDEKGRAKVRFRATNDSTLASALRLPYIGYTEDWQENVDPQINELTRGGILGTGAMTPTHQDFEWYETIQMTPEEHRMYERFNAAPRRPR